LIHKGSEKNFKRKIKEKKIKFPVVIKPVNEGSSLGVYICKIKFYTNDFLKKVEFISNIEFKDLNFLVRKKYFQDRVLLFGDTLHEVHPLAGQGFNMVLRDLSCLEKTLSNKINLGLDIGSSDILLEFSNATKPRNFVFSIGVDFLKNSFSFKKLRNDILKILNKSNFAKNILFNIADKGFNF